MPQYTRSEFAQKIKAKYPAYAEMDDNELVDRMLKKYPTYKSQISEEVTPIEDQPLQEPAAPKAPSPQTPEQFEEERGIKEQAYRSAHAAIPGAAAAVSALPDFLLEPYAAFESTLLGLAGGVADFAVQQRARFDDDLQQKLKDATPQERLQLWEDYNNAGDTIRDAVDASQFQEAHGSGSGSITTELAQGNLGAAAQLTANQTSAGLASLVPFVIPGGSILGPAILGASSAGQSFEEDISDLEKTSDATVNDIYNASYLKGGIELATEFVTAGIIGKAKRFAAGGAARGAVNEYTKAAWKSVLGDSFSEGISEGLSDLGSKITDSAIYGTEFDGREATVGFLDSAIVGAIVGGKVSTFGQAARTKAAEAVVQNTLRTDEQVQQDEARAKEFAANQTIIENADTEGSLVDQAVSEAATRRNDEIIDEQKTETKKRNKVLKDATNSELKVIADSIDKSKKLKEEAKKLETESDEYQAVQDEASRHDQAVLQQLEIIEQWPDIQKQKQQVIKENEAKIKEDEATLADAAKPTTNAEGKTQPKTAKAKLNEKKARQRIKDNKKNIEEVNKEVEALRPTVAKDVTSKVDKKAPQEVQRKQRDARLKEASDIIADPNLPAGQKKKAIRELIKSERGRLLVDKLARRLKANPLTIENALVQRADRLDFKQLKEGKLEEKLEEAIRKDVQRQAQKESKAIKYDLTPEEKQERDDEVAYFKDLRDNEVITPDDYKREVDNIDARFGKPIATGLEVTDSEGQTGITADVEQAAAAKAEAAPDVIAQNVESLAKKGGAKKVVDDYKNNLDEIFALVKSKPVRKGSFGGLFDTDATPSLERFDDVLQGTDNRNNKSKLKKLVEDRINDFYGLDSAELAGEDIMDGAFDYLEGKPKADVKKFLPLLGMLKRAFPGTKVVISKARMMEDFIEAGLDPAKAETVKGYTDGKVVVLNPEKLDYETPIHEFGHIWAQATRTQRPDLYKKGVELIKKSPYWTELLAKSEDKNSVYYGYSRKRLEEEAMATSIGQAGEQFFTEQQDINQWNALAQKIWEWIGQQLGMDKVKNLTFDQFNKLAVTEILTGEQFIKPEDIKMTEQSLIFNALQVPVGSTRDYTPKTAPAAEIDTHGVFNGKALKREALNTVNKHWQELQDGGWIGYTTGVYGEAAGHKFIPQLNAKIESKVKTLRDEFAKEGLTFTKDPKNPGFHIVKKQLEFKEETPRKKTNDLLKKRILKDIKNALKAPKSSSAYKYSRVSEAVREALKSTEIDLNRRGDQLTLEQLSALDGIVTAKIQEGKDYIKGVKKDQKQIREQTRAVVDNIVDQSPKDAPNYADRNKWVNKIKRLKLSNLLAPASNNDFHGLLYRMLPKGKARLGVWKAIESKLVDPLAKANVEHLAWKQRLRSQFEIARNELENAGHKLLQPSSVTVELAEGTHTLTKGELIKAYNYTKDPSLYGQMERGGFNFEAMNEIVDAVHKDPALRQYANAIAQTYASVAPAINKKLNEHGRRTFTNPRIEKDNLDDDSKALLTKVYGTIPSHAVYTPVTAEGADQSLEIDNLLKDGEYQMYSVMDGRLKQRTRGGKMKIAGTNTESEFESYLRGPVRTLAFMDFAKNASDVFGKDQLANMKLKYGDQWVDSMKDVLKRTVTGRNSPVRQTPAGKFIDRLLQRQVGGIMFFNVRSALLQHLSLFNYMFEDMGAVRNGARAPRAVKEKIAEKMQDYLKDRGRGRTELLVDDLFGREGTNFADYLVQKGYKLTQWGDKNAIANGGAAFMAGKYMDYVKNGMDEKQALDQAYVDFFKVTEETQQSTLPERLGREQTTPIGRYILAFANTPMQYNRKISRAIQDLKGLKGDNSAEGKARKRQAVGEIVWYMGAQNAIFGSLQSLSFAALGFDEGDDEQRAGRWANSLVNTLLRGAGLYGALAAAAKDAIRAAMNDKDAADAIIGASPALGSMVRNIRKATGSKPVYPRSALLDDIDTDVAKTIYQTAAGLTAVGFPAEKALKIGEQVADMIYSELNVIERLARAAGYERYQIGETLGGPLKRLQGGDAGQAHNDGTIEVDPNLSPVERQKTIAHEKQHVKDMRDRGLDYDDDFVYWDGGKHARKNGQIQYNGSWLKEGDPSLPWEKRAYNAEPGSPLKQTGDEDRKKREAELRKQSREYAGKYGFEDKSGQDIKFIPQSGPGKGHAEYGGTHYKPTFVGHAGDFEEAHGPEHFEGAKQWTKDWESNPITIQKDIARTGATEEELVHSLERQHKAQYAATQAGASTGATYDPHEHTIQDNPNFRGAAGFSPEATTAHEFAHAGRDLQRGEHLKEIIGDLKLPNQFGDKSYQNYVNRPHEQYGFLQQLRHTLGLKPGESITPEMIEARKKAGDENPILNADVKKLIEANEKVAATEGRRSLEDLYSNQQYGIVT